MYDDYIILNKGMQAGVFKLAYTLLAEYNDIDVDELNKIVSVVIKELRDKDKLEN